MGYCCITYSWTEKIPINYTNSGLRLAQFPHIPVELVGLSQLSGLLIEPSEGAERPGLSVQVPCLHSHSQILKRRCACDSHVIFRVTSCDTHVITRVCHSIALSSELSSSHVVPRLSTDTFSPETSFVARVSSKFCEIGTKTAVSFHSRLMQSMWAIRVSVYDT